MPLKSKMKFMGLRVSDQEYQALQQYCTKKKLTKSEVLREALQKLLEREQSSPKEHDRRCPMELIDKITQIYERQIERIIKLLSEKK